MKIKIIVSITVLCFVCILASCGSSAKINYTGEDLSALHELVDSKKIEIISDFAYPLGSTALNSLSNAGLFPPGSTSNQVSLVGNTNFLKIKGDSIKANLPYYGERRIGGGYNTSGTGIILDGLIEDLESKYNEKRQRYEIRFNTSHYTETYQITLHIFPNKKTYLNMNSTHRSTIAYRGDIAPIE